MRKSLRLFIATLYLGLFSFFQARSQCATSDVTQPSNQVVGVGNSSIAINFTGTVSGTTFKWTNSNPEIGLAAYGTGNIPSFTAANPTNAPIAATVTVTPYKGTDPYSYVPNSGTDNVSVIDVNTGSVIKTIAVGSSPQGVTVAPDGGKVYVANTNSNNVSVIYTATNSVIATIPVGSAPQGIAVTPDGSKVYVANMGSNDVSVINTATNSVTATIPVGSSPTGMAAAPDGSKVYVANRNSNNVSVINTVDNTVGTPIVVGHNPYGLTITPDGSKVYVTNVTSNNISVIDVGTSTVVKTIAVGSNPTGLAASPDGSKVYVANLGSSFVSVINTVDNTVGTPIAVGNDHLGIAITPDGSKVYVANFSSNNIKVINSATNSVTATITVGANPYAFGNMLGLVPCPGTSKTFTITASPIPNVADVANQTVCDNTATTTINFTGSAPGTVYKWTNDNPAIGLAASGAGIIPSFTATNTTNSPMAASVTVTPHSSLPYAYVPNAGSDNISVIDVNTRAVIKTINVGGYSVGVAPAPDGSKVYVTNPGARTVSVINTANNEVSAVINIAASTEGLAVAPDGGKVYVADPGTGKVLVINTATNTVVNTITVGIRPYNLAVAPDGSKLYVSNNGSGTVSVINTATSEISATIPVGSEPMGLAVTPDGSKVYVANYNSGTVSEINTTTNVVSANITVGTTENDPFNLAVTPDGSKLYVTILDIAKVASINTATHEVSTITVDVQPFGVTITPDGGKAYVTSYSSGAVDVIDTGLDVLETSILVGNIPTGSGNMMVSVPIYAGPSKTFTFTVNSVPPTPSVTSSGSTTICAGSSVILTSSASSGNQWYNGTTLLTGETGQTYTATVNGNYSVMVTTTCGTSAASTPVAVTVNPIPSTPTITAGSTSTFCEGGNVTLTSSSTAGNQWLKDGSTIAGATGQSYTATTGGNYTVQVNENGCTSAASAAIQVTVNPAPAVPVITAAGNVLTSSATTGNQWYLNGSAITGAAAKTYNVQASGPYTVRVTQGGCTVTSAVYNFVATSVNEPANWNGEVMAYPAPVSSILYIKNGGGRKLQLQLFDGFGRRVYEGKLTGASGTINVQGLAAGVYQLLVTDIQKNQTISQTILKN